MTLMSKHGLSVFIKEKCRRKQTSYHGNVSSVALLTAEVF